MMEKCVHEEWKLFQQGREVLTTLLEISEGIFADLALSEQVLVVQRDSLVCISHFHLASTAHGLPLGEEVGKPLDVVGTILGRVCIVREHTVDRALTQRLLNVLAHGHPLQVVVLFVELGLGLDRILKDTLHKEESHQPVFDCLHFDEGVDVELVVQPELSLLINFSQGAVFGCLPLVHLALREVKFADDSVPWVVVHHEEE